MYMFNKRTQKHVCTHSPIYSLITRTHAQHKQMINVEAQSAELYIYILCVHEDTIHMLRLRCTSEPSHQRQIFNQIR